MIHEYLFLTDDNRADVEAYKPDGITVEISAFDNSQLWVVAYSAANINEASAKRLSDVHSFIKQYSPLVLSCESSEYYNRKLFPLVNKLERKLRKLLYLAASISDSERAKESIKQLEEKDFGEIFDLLFIDQNFISKLKQRVNADNKSEFNGKSKYSKAEIKEYIDSLYEQTLWDDILGDRNVPTLRSRFRDVQAFRNDVMHARNIGKGIFAKSRYLFDKINRELDGAIGDLMASTEGELTETKPDVNTAISSAMMAIDSPTISEALRIMSASNVAMGISPQWSQIMQDGQPLNASLADSIKFFQLRLVQPELAEVIKGLYPIVQNLAVTEALRSAAAFPSSSAIESLRRQLEKTLGQRKAFQDSMRSVTDKLPLTVGPMSDSDEDDKPAQDNKRQEEATLNEES